MTRADTMQRSLGLLRTEISPTLEDKSRLRARVLGPALAVAPEPAAVTGSPALGSRAPARTRWAALREAGTLGVAAGSLLLALGGAGGFWLGRSVAPAPAAPSAPPPASAPSATPPLPAAASLEGPLAEGTAPGEPTSAELEPRPEQAPPPRPMAAAARAPRPSPRAVPARRRPAAEAPSPVNGELALLQRVERALRNGDPALALALLAELDERFPGSRLLEEREAARAIARCRTAEPGAAPWARSFLGEHPSSVYRQRIQLACALEPPASASDGTLKNAD